MSRFLVRPATTMITVAPTGAESRRADVPRLPTTPEEIAAEAAACEAAGAAMIHIHVRDADHAPTLDLPRVRETVAAVREACSLVVQLSTGGSVHDPMDARLAVLDAEPDSCSLTLGTVNFGDDVFMNPWGFVVELFRRSRDRGIVPEFEVFDLGQLSTLRRLLDREGLPAGDKVHVDLVMGVPGGMPGTADALVACVAAMPEQVTSWSATGIGRSHLPVLAASLAAGGHLRVGMEDTVVWGRGPDGPVPVASNADLVHRAARVATELQRPPMAVHAARDLLGLPAR
ncbi:3-keto-5-aminohexanoate cleavage protein [Aquipuribacter sp. MA13-6]|uniref:3-keto-5-aminohexanoate cleavage protein n=1 Tax=unclassified Aquipuribacter TaxID=2635084 RepID=UPI003EE978BE